MLTKVVFENFKSFKNKTVIDLNKTDSDFLKEPNTFNNVLKGVYFFGSNSTGKTVVLLVIKFLLDALFNNDEIDYLDLKHFNNEKEVYFEYHFLFNKKRYIYTLIIDDNIKKEELKINDKVYFEKEKETSLYLKYLKEDFNVSNLYNYLNNSIAYNISSYNKKEEEKELINDYLAKYGVSKINKFLKGYNFPYLIEYSDNIYFLKNDMKIIYQKESYGNRMLLNLIALIDLITINKGILLIDEFTNSLHNKLEELIVRYFFKEAKDSQLIFVSHSTNLLKMSLLRLDQIYVVDIDKDGSNLRRLSSENIRIGQNIEKMYLSGMFGGVPLYDPFE